MGHLKQVKTSKTNHRGDRAALYPLNQPAVSWRGNRLGKSRGESEKQHIPQLLAISGRGKRLGLDTEDDTTAPILGWTLRGARRNDRYPHHRLTRDLSTNTACV